MANNNVVPYKIYWDNSMSLIQNLYTETFRQRRPPVNKASNECIDWTSVADSPQEMDRRSEVCICKLIECEIISKVGKYIS